MLVVQLDCQGGWTAVFQMPWRLVELGAGTGGGDEQVAAVREVQCGQARIVGACSDRGEALVGRQVIESRVVVQAQVGPSLEGPVVGGVLGAQSLVRKGEGGLQLPYDVGVQAGLRAERGVVPAPISGRGGDEQGGGRRSGDA